MRSFQRYFLAGLVFVMVLYISTLHAKTTSIANTSSYGPVQSELENSMQRGAEIYTDYCLQCHLSKGEGVAETYPPLANSDWLTPEKRKQAIAVVKYGQQGEIMVNGISYNGIMANLGLYDDEVADVMNYIMNNWGNQQEQMVTEAEVKSIKP